MAAWLGVQKKVQGGGSTGQVAVPGIVTIVRFVVSYTLYR